MTTANSMVGARASDLYAEDGFALTNGNYVIVGPKVDSPNGVDVGAATLLVGGATRSGVVSAANSLMGGTAGDSLGERSTAARFVALPNGNFLMASPRVDSAGKANVGAITWFDGTTGTVGVISEANSLLGSTAEDSLGSSGIVTLPNGHAVVRSPLADIGGLVDAGAVTWIDGTRPTTGTDFVGASLVGSSSGDKAGESTVQALASSHYVVPTPLWTNGDQASAGAVTVQAGDRAYPRVISPENSLVGSRAGDRVGASFVLTSPAGFFVIGSGLASNGLGGRGALTRMLPETPVVGPLDSSNSLVVSGAATGFGSGSNSQVLSNGNLVVASQSFDSGAGVGAGAFTVVKAGEALTGFVSAENSLFGLTANADIVRGAEHPTLGIYYASFPRERQGIVRVLSTTTGTGSLPTSDADLASLDQGQDRIAPAFSPATTSYLLNLPRNATTAAFDFATSDINAAVQMRVDGGAWTYLMPGKGSGVIPVSATGVVVELRVYARDYVTQKTYSVTLHRLTKLDAWRERYFANWASNPNSVPDAIPTKDGIPNLAKFAFGLDPTRPGTIPVTMATASSLLELTFPMNPEAADAVSIGAEWADSPTAPAWSTEGVVVEVVEDTPTSRRLRITLPFGTAPVRLVRLRVTSL